MMPIARVNIALSLQVFIIHEIRVLSNFNLVQFLRHGSNDIKSNNRAGIDASNLQILYTIT
jgi:hypothetical protein